MTGLASTKADRWLFRKRGGAVLVFFLLLFVCLPPAVAYRQVQFQDLGGEGYLGKEVYDQIPARRGSFKDRYGREIAGSSARYEIFANPRRMDSSDIDIAKASVILEPAVGKSSSAIAKLLAKNSSRVVLCKNSSPEQRESLNGFKRSTKTKYYVQEVGTDRFYERSYPMPGMPGNILGWTRREEGTLVGVEGLELTLDYLLAGQDGLRTGTRGLNGLPIAGGYLVVEEAVDGNDILLTLDRDVQVIAYEAISHWVRKTGALRGAAVVIQAGSGDFLAMAQYPGVEPTNSSGCIDNEDVRLDFICRALYEPGSVGKPFVAATGINSGAITRESSFYVENWPIVVDEYTVGEYHTIWKTAGRRTVSEILIRSSNIGMTKIGFALEEETIREAIQSFGFNEKPDLHILGVPSALMPTESRRLAKIEMANLSFGQGYAVTPAQVALAFNVFASKGIFHPGRLIYGVQDSVSGSMRLLDEPASREILTEETCTTMVDILNAVTIDGTGGRACVDGYQIAGKTGTAQVSSPDGGYYDEEENYYIVSFAGFGPLPDAKYTILVVIERPREKKYDAGGKTAAPCFADIFSGLMDLEKRRNG